MRAFLAFAASAVVVAMPMMQACGRLGYDLEPATDALAPGDATLPADAAGDAFPAGDDGPVGPTDDATDDGSPAGDATDDGASGDATVEGGPGDASSDAACTASCSNAHGTTTCAGATCLPVCAAGFDDCDSDKTNGCETPTTTVSHCGSCTKACSSDAGTPVCSGGACTVNCDFTGTWATKLSVAVTWMQVAPSLAAGSDTFTFWARMTATAGSPMPVTFLLCGITVPDFKSSALGGNEPYGLTFPTTLFDHTPAPFLPGVPTTVTLGGTTPGSTFSVPTIAFLVGLTMTNPTTDMWPDAATIASADVDGDGHPAVTAQYKSGGSYLFPPIDFAKSARSDATYIADRLVGSFSGTLGDCASGSGTASVGEIDSRIVGCDLSGGGGACMPAQASFEDGNKPVYMPGAATVALKKVATGATCAQVRAALP